MKKLNIIKLTNTEINHLLHLILKNEMDGFYSGPLKQYEARSLNIKSKLMEAIEK